MVSPVLKPVSQLKLAPGSNVTIPDISWLEFESILEDLGNKRSARIAYYRGCLQIMAPLPEHEKPKDLISDLVKSLLKKLGKDYEPWGSTTYKRKNIAGIEPDLSFYIQNYQQILGKRRLTEAEPPPDLAIEIDVTSKTSIDAYLALGVPEVWILDRGQITIYILSNGEYLSVEFSPTFPCIPLKEIVPTLIDRAWEIGNVRALLELEEGFLSHD